MFSCIILPRAESKKGRHLTRAMPAPISTLITAVPFETRLTYVILELLRANLELYNAYANTY